MRHKRLIFVVEILDDFYRFFKGFSTVNTLNPNKI